MTAHSDQQERCDTLYTLASSTRWDKLVGISSREVVAWLGPPDRVFTLVHEGVRWTRIVYLCNALPATASEEERGAYERGWRFSPTLLLRNGKVVLETAFDAEVVRGRRTAGPRLEFEFREGGTFP